MTRQWFGSLFHSLATRLRAEQAGEDGADILFQDFYEL